MSLLAKIPGVALIEAALSGQNKTGTEATFPEPDFSNLSDQEILVWTRRYSLIELSRRLRDDNEKSLLRKKYAQRIYNLTVGWLGLVIILTVISGFSLPDREGIASGIYHVKFQLTDAVLIALAGTTTVNVIALFLAVTAWLFPKDAGVHVEPSTAKSGGGG